MKVLVTGAKGFIGKVIVTELEKNNIEVFQIIRPKTDSESIHAGNKAKIFFVDITDYKNFREIEGLEKIDAIIHSAGLAHQFGDTEKEEFEAVNVKGTSNVSEIAVKLKVKQFILISSTAVYGIKKKFKKNSQRASDVFIIDENTTCIPETDYARSKLDGEKVCREICEKNKIPLTIFRLAPVIGEGNSGNVARLIASIDNGRFFWIGKGNNSKTLIYKRDIARACLKILKEKKGETEIFNLAAEPIQMNRLVDKIADVLEKRIPRMFIPPMALKVVLGINTKFLGVKKINKIAQTIEKWLSDDFYAGKKIADEYEFTPETSIEEAIEKQVKWYKQQKF
jgi:UDP-glucose 4-epimerase